MKRLLRGSKPDRKQDEGNTSPVGQKKMWANAPVIGALQPSRPKNVTQPQIRHLALEGHTGPVTKATMDEIRREAGSSGSNFRINSLTTSTTDAKSSSAGSPAVSNGSNNRSPQPLGADSTAAASAAAVVAPWVTEKPKEPRPATPKSAPLLSQTHDATVNTANLQAASEDGGSAIGSTQLPLASHPAEAEKEAAKSAEAADPAPPGGSNGASSSSGSASAKIGYPPRTTSTVVMPPKIDTISKPVQRTQSQSMRIASPEKSSMPPNPAVANDTDVSAPAGISSLHEELGFDASAVLETAAEQSGQHQGSLAMAPADPAKRMISEKIRSLATRFSNTNLGESPEQPPTPPPMSRRPSNSPSVTERVSQFVQQSADPRSAGIFGKFGDVSAKVRMRSSSSSVAETPARNGQSLGLPDFGTNPAAAAIAALGQGRRRPLSTYQGIDLSGRLPDSDAHGPAAGDASYEPSGMPSSRNSAAINIRDSGHFAYEIPYTNAGANSSFTSELNLNDSEDDGYSITPQHVLKSKASTGHQLTMASGVRVNFSRSAADIDAHAANGDFGGVYRGVRADSLARHRGSVQATFESANASPAAQDGGGGGLRIVTDPIDTTNSHRPSPSSLSHRSWQQLQSGTPEGASDAPASIDRTSSGPASPTGTRKAATGSFRRAGSVIPGRPGSMASLAEIQRNISAASNGHDGGAAGVSRSQSQKSTHTTATHPASQRASGHSSALDLQHGGITTPQSLAIDLDSDEMLLNALSRDLDINSSTALDELFSKPAKAKRTAIADSSASDSGTDDSIQARADVAAAASLVLPVLSEASAAKILPLSEYERFVREVPSLKSRLQSARTRLSLEIRMRDTAKNLAELNHKSSTSKLKSILQQQQHQQHQQQNQAQLDEYNAANAKVQQVEMEIADLSTKLRLTESYLHDHQLAVLAAAVRTILGQAMHMKNTTQEYSAMMERRIHALERSEADIRAEKESILAESAKATADLEAQLRRLQNINHDAQSRRISKEAEDFDPESPLTRHSANRAVERLNGEVLVLREQKAAADSQVKSLEAKLDEALLKAQEAQHAFNEIRSQASDMAEVSRSKIELAREEAEMSRQCVEAFKVGLRETLEPLRSLKGIHDAAERMRSLQKDENASTRTPPATPTLKISLGMPKDALSIDELESILSEDKDPSGLAFRTGVMPGEKGRVALDAADVSSAMALIASTISGCSGLYSDALRICDAQLQLQKELSTEKRLREAQSLAIAQQRERLTKTSLLAENADHRVKEATDALVAKHAVAQRAWDEERAKLFVGIERLTLDINDLKAAGSSSSTSGHNPDAYSTSTTAGSVAGGVEHVYADQQAHVQSLQERVSSLNQQIDSMKEQIADKISENAHIRLQIEELAPLRERTSQMDGTINKLKATEAELRNRLAELEPLAASGRGVDAALSPKEPVLGDYVQRLKEANALLASAPSPKPSTGSDTNENGESLLRSATGARTPTMGRRLSLPMLSPARTTEQHTAAAVEPALAFDQRTFVDAQTMTDVDTGEDIKQMHLAYSEKLMRKEDALRNREDELEAIRALVAEIESNLQSALPNPSSESHDASIGYSASSASPRPSSSYKGLNKPLPKVSLRNRSSSFFQGLRTSYLGLNGSPDLQPRPAPETQPLSVVTTQLGRMVRVPSSQSLNQSASSSSPQTGRGSTGADGVPSFVQSLIPLAHQASTEVRRLKSLICDLEDESREARIKLLETQTKLTNLQSYCSVRAKMEESVQQDITHVLGQISRLRTKVAQLEKEKAACEGEARALWKRCHDAEHQTAEQVLQLITERVGKAEWTKRLGPDGVRRSATEPGHKASTEASESADDRTASYGASADRPQQPAVPSKFASLSAISVSHPQASEIRAEFNELLHQVIARRDEDLERIQTLADSLRIDVRRAANDSKNRAWNTATRGIQTI